MKRTAKYLVQVLQEKGYEAMYAGGAVRDMLLGIEPKDIDIVTSARPEEIEALFQKTFPIGKAFGVILVVEGGHQFEIATFRSDAGYSDGRRPDYVTFTNAEEDAQRRDFTVNGMYYDPIKDEVLDFVGGKNDLEAKVIRFIGNPDERIQEDHLRLLRTVRFAHQIEGQYEPETYRAVKEYAHLIADVAWERVRDEFNKMLYASTRSDALEDLQDLGLLPHIFPELEKLKGVAQPYNYHKEGSVWNHAMQSLRSLEGKNAENIELLWAVLLHDIGKPDTFSVKERIRFDGHAEKSAEIAREVLKRFRMPKKNIENICWAVEHHMSLFHLLDKKTSELTKRKWFTHPNFPLLLETHRADVLGTDPSDLSFYHKLKEEMEKVLKELPEELPKLISGHEVVEYLGIEAGKELGEVMEKIRDQQLLGKIKTKKQVLEFLKTL